MHLLLDIALHKIKLYKFGDKFLFCAAKPGEELSPLKGEIDNDHFNEVHVCPHPSPICSFNHPYDYSFSLEQGYSIDHQLLLRCRRPRRPHPSHSQGSPPSPRSALVPPPL